MEFNNFEERKVFLKSQTEVKNIKELLKLNDLRFEEDIEYTVAIYDEEKIIGTGSFAGNVLKCIAVDSDYQGYGISNRIVTHLINKEFELGRTHLFIFTKPKSSVMFQDLGFYKIAEVLPNVVLLENRKDGIKDFVDNIKKLKADGEKVSALVMNCNPFTLGHQYVIEKASRESDVVHIFVVWEDKSSFPKEVRLDLIKKGTSHLKNVYVHKGENYIISNATFPSYFIKEGVDIVEAQCQLDLKIFAEYIAPALNITTRFVGEEPYCPITSVYNTTMKKLLPEYGIEVIEISRLKVGDCGNIVSASKVREMIRLEDFVNIKRFVPNSTYEFLSSKEAEPIIKKIVSEQKRH
jgi:[citrate (pro-3S)-lyase] ligase